MNNLRKIYYKNETLIKSIFTIIILALFITIPVIFFLTTKDEMDVIDYSTPKLQFKQTPKQINDYDPDKDETSDPDTPYSADWVFSFDTSFNDKWKIEDYYVIIDTNSHDTLTSSSIGQNVYIDESGETVTKDMIWVDSSRYLTDDGFALERAFKQSVLYEDMELENEDEKIVKEIFEQTKAAESFDNTANPENPQVHSMKEDEAEYKIFATARVRNSYTGVTSKIEIDSNQILDIESNKNATIQLAQVGLNESKSDWANSSREAVTTDGTITTINNFLSNNNSKSKISAFDNSFIPEIKFVGYENNNIYGVSAFEEVPTLKLKATSTDSIDGIDGTPADKTTIDLFTWDQKLNSDKKFTRTITLPQEIYDPETDLLKYDTFDIEGTIEWKLKTEENFRNDLSKATGYDYDYFDIKTSTGADFGVTHTIKIGEESSPIRINKDLSAYSDILYINRSKPLKFILAPGWNDNGQFGYYFLLNSDGVFNNENLFNGDSSFVIRFYWTNETGETNITNTGIQSFDSCVCINEKEYLYSFVKTNIDLNEKSKYWIGNKSFIWWQYNNTRSKFKDHQSTKGYTLNENNDDKNKTKFIKFKSTDYLNDKGALNYSALLSDVFYALSDDSTTQPLFLFPENMQPSSLEIYKYKYSKLFIALYFLLFSILIFVSFLIKMIKKK